MDLLRLESLSLWIALVGYSVVCVLVMVGLVFGRRLEKKTLAIMALAVLLHTLAIIFRWWRIGHVPVGSAFEMLSANVWGLMVAVTFGYWLLPRFRGFATVLMPLIIMIMAWMLLKPSVESSLPPTYETVWLYIHIAFIKMFLGCAFVALGISGIVLLRKADIGVSKFSSMPDDKTLDGRAYRFMALALIFDSLGIVAGSIWAQDAWGRYWSWDTLETWSLVTWLSIGLSLHVRVPFKTSPAVNAWLTLSVFVIAFFTFFGIPFVTTALHKGQI